MREVQCSNVYVLLKNRAILRVRGDWRNDGEPSIPMGHRACNAWAEGQDVSVDASAGRPAAWI